MKKIISILAIISIFIGCSKENTPMNKNENDNTLRSGGGSVFYFNGQVTDSSLINWNSNTLNIVMGIHGMDTVLTFGNDASLIYWASFSNQGQFILDLLDLKDTALIVAEAMDEFDYLETNGEHSRDYQEFLDSFTHNRGATKLYEHEEYLGDNETYWTSKGYVGNKMNNKASSMEFGFVGGMLADWKWWSGKKFFFWTLLSGYHPRLDKFNDKATSILIY